jgi:hypothetical protein
MSNSIKIELLIENFLENVSELSSLMMSSFLWNSSTRFYERVIFILYRIYSLLTFKWHERFCISINSRVFCFKYLVYALMIYECKMELNQTM